MKSADWLQLHPLLKIVLAFIIGLVIARTFNFGTFAPWWLWLGITIVALLVALLCRSHARWQGVCIFGAFVFWGMSLYTLQDCRSDSSLPTGEQVAQGVIMSPLISKGKVVQCDVLLTKGLLSGKKVKASILKDTLQRRYQQLGIGSGIVFRAVFRPFENLKSKSHFDYLQWMYLHGYRAQTFIYFTNWQTCAVDFHDLPRVERLRLFAQQVRSRLLQILERQGLCDQDYAVIAAMTLGDKSSLSKSTKELYSITGTSHLLALSGLHLSILFGLLSVVFGRRHLLNVVIVILTIWAYIFLTGMSSSLLRSGLMLTLYSLVSLLNRHRMSLNALSFAAIVMLMIQPMLLWDVSFQLSFMAVLAILILYHPIYHLLPLHWLQSTSFIRLLWGMMTVSVAAQIGTAPLVAYYFGRFSCYFLFTNLIAVPLTTFILYTACLVFMLSFWTSAQNIVAKIMACTAQCLNQQLSVIASWTGASVENIHLTAIQVLAIYLLIGCGIGFLFYLSKSYRQSKIY